MDTLDALTHLFGLACRAVAVKLHRGLISKTWEDADRIAYCEAARLFTWAPHDPGIPLSGCGARTAALIQGVCDYEVCQIWIEGTSLFFWSDEWRVWNRERGTWRSLLDETRKLEAKANV